VFAFAFSFAFVDVDRDFAAIVVWVEGRRVEAVLGVEDVWLCWYEACVFGFVVGLACWEVEMG
jgi:hypothetical protein